MDTSEPLEPLEDILAAAQAAVRFIPTDKQRKDWRGAGLIPEPVKRPGRGKKHGSTAFYPPGTGELLAAVCRHSKPKKPLPQLAFLVWWDGYDLPVMGLVRSALYQTLDEWERIAAPWRDLDKVPADAWGEVDRRIASRRLPAELRVARDRVGNEPFRYLIGTLLNIAAGGFNGFRPYSGADAKETRDDVRAALGLYAATWVPEDITKSLTDLSAIVKPESLREVLDGATDADLNLARDEARDLVRLIGDVGHLAARLSKSGELDPFTHFGGEMPTAGVLAGCTLFWLSASRHPALRQHYRQLFSVMRMVSTIGSMLIAYANQTDERMIPQRRQPSGIVAPGEDTSTCNPILSP